MDENNKNLELSPEEQNAEEEATKEVQEDELKESLAEEFGLDPDEDAETLEKLVKREKAHREKLSGAIKQKRNWREKALKGTSKETQNNSGSGKPPVIKPDTQDLDKLIEEKLAERDLEQLGYSDELKTEIRTLAKLRGISVREAAKSSYILFKKEEMEKVERMKNATPKRSNKGSNYVANIDPSKPLNPNDYDFSSEEGRNAWKEAKAARRKYEASR